VKVLNAVEAERARENENVVATVGVAQNGAIAN
jgi:hypothetical protein